MKCKKLKLGHNEVIWIAVYKKHRVTYDKPPTHVATQSMKITECYKAVDRR